MGAGLIDCDKIAHRLYKSGTCTFEQVVDEFGSDIVGEDGEIDRKILGGIVFSDSVNVKIRTPVLYDLMQEVNFLLSHNFR